MESGKTDGEFVAAQVTVNWLTFYVQRFIHGILVQADAGDDTSTVDR